MACIKSLSMSIFDGYKKLMEGLVVLTVIRLNGKYQNVSEKCIRCNELHWF
jgi:hypothetical protein